MLKHFFVKDVMKSIFLNMGLKVPLRTRQDSWSFFPPLSFVAFVVYSLISERKTGLHLVWSSPSVWFQCIWKEMFIGIKAFVICTWVKTWAPTVGRPLNVSAVETAGKETLRWKLLIVCQATHLVFVKRKFKLCCLGSPIYWSKCCDVLFVFSLFIYFWHFTRGNESCFTLLDTST